jgi:uncharacterized protein (UPF0210 family)
MRRDLTRRRFLGLAGAGLAIPYFAPLLGARTGKSFRIRAVTAGVPLEHASDTRPLDSALAFLRDARDDLRSGGWEVQTIRAATQPLAEYLPDWSTSAGLDSLAALDEAMVDADAAFSVGPVITGDEHDTRFGPWAADAVQRTANTSFSVRVASPASGVHRMAIRSAAEAIAAIGRGTPGGEGNFRFAAAAFVPAGTPFFPSAWFTEPRTFSIGLESPPLLGAVVTVGLDHDEARGALVEAMNSAIGEIELAAEEIARRAGWRFLGVDVSPAPGLDASIGDVVERLSGAPFGNPSTLATCALLTDVLRGLAVRTCGYSGLMLPVLEDPVLARRAAEGRYGISELLLYSSVCGTGLDVVPLPGDTSIEGIAALIEDVAALAAKYQKPLSARLLPIPGKRAGESVNFDNPYLTEGVVMATG